MILLRHDCLVFKTSDGESFPCSTKEVTVEILGDAIGLLDEEIIKQASEGVLHYFKAELGKTTVTIAEFSTALEQALKALGLHVQNGAETPSLSPAPRVVRSDLINVAMDAGQGLELFFFPQLRTVLEDVLKQSPDIACFRGLRGCVKQLLHAKRWSPGCQQLNDQIVDFLRSCFDIQKSASSCALLVC
jgi:hypothetical protein